MSLDLTKCRHENLAKLEGLSDGYVQWVCECGRTPKAKPGLTREQVIGFLRCADAFTAQKRGIAAGSAEDWR